MDIIDFNSPEFTEALSALEPGKCIAVSGMPDDRYHATTGLGGAPDQRLTRSILCDMIESPTGFKRRYIEECEHSQRPKGTPAMWKGTVFEAMLDPTQDWDCEALGWAYYPEHLYRPGTTDFCTKKDSKLERKELEAEAEAMGTKLIRPGGEFDCFSVCELMASEMEAVPMWQAIKQSPGVLWQITMIWIDEETGLHMQCRPDFVAPKLRLMGDIKSTNKKPSEISKAARERGYDVQQYMAEMAWQMFCGVGVNYVIPAQMNCFPWEGSVEYLQAYQVQLAGLMYRKAVNDIAAGNWHNLQDTPHESEAPAYVMYAMESATGVKK